MIFVTGDTHFPLDAAKLFKSRKGFALSKLQRTDYLIVLGDFGLFWSKKASTTKKICKRFRRYPILSSSLTGTMKTLLGWKISPSWKSLEARRSAVGKIFFI